MNKLTKVLKYWKEIVIGLLVVSIICTMIIGDSPPKNLTEYDVEFVDVEWDRDSDGIITIEGFILNDDKGLETDFIEITIFLLDGRGNIIGSEFALCTEYMAYGDEGYFETNVYDTDGVRDIRLQIKSLYAE